MEICDIYNAQGEKTGRTAPRAAPLQPGEYRLCAEVWIVNSSGQILIQKRSQSRKVLPGFWALTTGLVAAGETSAEGCLREAREEIGIELAPENLRLLTRIVRTDTIWDVYCIRQEYEAESAVLQKEEVSRIMWVNSGEFRRLLACGALYRYPEIEEILKQVEARRDNPADSAE